MAETALGKRRRFALQAISEHLQELGACPLTTERVRSLDEGGREGWSLKDEAGKLSVVFTDEWPFDAPEFYISKDHPKFRDANVGDDGKLCLAPSHATYSQKDPAGLFDALLVGARELLTRAEVPPQELVDEFQSYWLRDLLPRRTCLSLLNPEGPSRMVACWHGEKQSVYGETQEDVLSFLKRRHRVKTDPEITVEPFLWFSRGLVPGEFPRRARHLWDLAKQLAPDGVQLLLSVISRPQSRIAFGFDAGNGPALAALTLRPPEKFTKGFRGKRMCEAVAASRFFGIGKAEACKIQRVDHAWIHSRGGEASNINLKGKAVVILGCGSLGSGFAMLLAKSGVGRLMLLDGDMLSWNNIGRHALGAGAVNQNKAEAMAGEIQSQLPSISVKGIGRTWQDAERNGVLDFSEFDLVVSTSGDWPSDSMLNFKSRRELEFPPVIFTWFEPHASAGHALLVADMGGCFACGTDEFGKFGPRLTEWPQGSVLQREPACGAYFQPYGPSQMTSTQSLAANFALDVLGGRSIHSELRSFVAAKAGIESLGGQWTERAHAAGIGLEGGFATEKWVCAQHCELC